MSNIRLQSQSDIDDTKESSVFDGSERERRDKLYKWLESVAKEYLRAKRKRDRAARRVERHRERIKELIRALEKELGFRK